MRSPFLPVALRSAMFVLSLLPCLALPCVAQANSSEEGPSAVRRLLGPLVLVRPLAAETLQRLTDEAESSYRSGRLRHAQESFEAVVEMVPNHAPSWLRLGNLHQRQGRRDRAMAAYRKAIASSAADSDQVRRKALFNMAVLHLDEIDKILVALESPKPPASGAAAESAADLAGQAGLPSDAAPQGLREEREDAAARLEVLTGTLRPQATAR